MTLALALLFALLAGGVAVFMAIGITAATMMLGDGLTAGGIAQIIVDRLNSSTLTAVPFFVIAAAFMQRGGMAAALVEAAQAWVGGVRGGLAFVVVASAALFASISGSSTATALALSTILLPALAAHGYTRRFSIGLLGSSATLGILLPPSLALIIYGLVIQVPIPKLFLAGLMPAALQGLLFAAWIAYKTRDVPVSAVPTYTLAQRLALTARAWPAFAVPFVALGGIYSGIVTLCEASALAALTAIVICWANGAVRGWAAIETIGDAIRNSTAILIIVGFAVLLGHWVVLSGLPQVLIAWLQAADVTALEFLIAVSLIMFVLGMFLEVVSTILLTAPLVLPLLGPLGVDPIHFGIVVIVNMELAALTPPVGLNLFVMSNVAKTPVTDVIRAVAPFIVLLLALLALVIVFPELSLWLPRSL